MNALGLLILRVGAGGLLLIGHGLPKLMEYGDKVETFPDPLGIGSQFSLILAIGGELLAAGMIMIGLLTRLACIGPIGAMVAAVMHHHGRDDAILKMDAAPGAQSMELALIYAIPFIALFFTGPGAMSVDRAMFGRSHGED